jgi:hypothetical protein
MASELLSSGLPVRLVALSAGTGIDLPTGVSAGGPTAATTTATPFRCGLLAAVQQLFNAIARWVYRAIEVNEESLRLKSGAGPPVNQRGALFPAAGGPRPHAVTRLEVRRLTSCVDLTTGAE